MLLGNIFTIAQQPDWENPEVFAVNKEATRATSLPYPNEALAKVNNYAESPFYQSLDGVWKFFWVPKVAQIPNGFWNENYTVSAWADMPVPGNWEFNGFGLAYYKNIGFGFVVKPPYIDREEIGRAHV